MSIINSKKNNSIQIIQLSRPKVNALNLDMIQLLSQHLDEAMNDRGIKGVIITGTPGIFSGGLDIVELARKNRDYMQTFWNEFSQLLIKIYSFPKLIFSAISGHSPAGGTVIAIMTDYRVMNSGKYFIGLNEVAVGLTMPISIGTVSKNILGDRIAEKMTLKGELIFPDKAKEIGLIDKIINEPLNLLNETMSVMGKWFQLPFERQIESKLLLRQPTLDLMEDNIKKDNKIIIEAWFSKEGQAIRQKIIDNLKK